MPYHEETPFSEEKRGPSPVSGMSGCAPHFLGQMMVDVLGDDHEAYQTEEQKCGTGVEEGVNQAEMREQSREKEDTKIPTELINSFNQLLKNNEVFEGLIPILFSYITMYFKTSVVMNGQLFEKVIKKTEAECRGLEDELHIVIDEYERNQGHLDSLREKVEAGKSLLTEKKKRIKDIEERLQKQRALNETLLQGTASKKDEEEPRDENDDGDGAATGEEEGDGGGEKGGEEGGNDEGGERDGEGEENDEGGEKEGEEGGNDEGGEGEGDGGENGEGGEDDKGGEGDAEGEGRERGEEEDKAFILLAFLPGEGGQRDEGDGANDKGGKETGEGRREEGREEGDEDAKGENGGGGDEEGGQENGEERGTSKAAADLINSFDQFLNPKELHIVIGEYENNQGHLDSLGQKVEAGKSLLMAKEKQIKDIEERLQRQRSLNNTLLQQSASEKDEENDKDDEGGGSEEEEKENEGGKKGGVDEEEGGGNDEGGQKRGVDEQEEGGNDEGGEKIGVDEEEEGGNDEGGEKRDADEQEGGGNDEGGEKIGADEVEEVEREREKAKEEEIQIKMEQAERERKKEKEVKEEQTTEEKNEEREKDDSNAEREGGGGNEERGEEEEREEDGREGDRSKVAVDLISTDLRTVLAHYDVFQDLHSHVRTILSRQLFEKVLKAQAECRGLENEVQIEKQFLTEDLSERD